MPIPKSREQLLDAIEINFERLARDLGKVPAHKTNEATLEGHAKGRVMSVHNLASYLLGWNNLVLKWIEKDAKGEPINFPETAFKWNQLGALAQKFYADFDAVPFDQLLKDLEIAKQKIVDFLSDQTDEFLYGASWHGKIHHGSNDPTQYVFALCQCASAATEVEASERYCVIQAFGNGPPGEICVSCQPNPTLFS